MIIVQYLKAMMDIAFLYSTFGTICMIVFSINSSLLPIVILPCIYLFSYFLKGKKHRYLSFALAVLIIPFVENFQDIIMPIFILIYLYLLIKEDNYGYFVLTEVRRFQIQAKILPVFIILGYVFQVGSIISQYTLPVVILYFMSSNLFLRMIRADENTIKSKAFLKFNLLSLLGVVLTALIISSDRFLTTVSNFASYIYNVYIYPFVAGFVAIFVWIIKLISQIIMLLLGDIESIDMSDVSASMTDLESTSYISTFEEYQTPSWLLGLGIFIATAVFALLLWYFIHKMLDTGKEKDEQSYTNITLEKSDFKQDKSHIRIFLSPREKLRKYYGEFMVYAKKQGIDISPTTDTEQLESMFGQNIDTKVLKEDYRHARYDFSREVKKEQVSRVKNSLKNIKSKEKAR